MKLEKNSMLLYAVTDRRWLQGASLSEKVEEALSAGITFLQLREKELPYEEFLKEAIALKKLAALYHVPFVVNDDIDIALQSGADGVHVGQSDIKGRDIRRLLGTDKILGISAGTVAEAIAAEAAGADYIGVGAVFPTGTKNDADYVPHDELQRICKSVSIPVVAIGGITEQNIPALKGSGINGVAVVSAIFEKENIKNAVTELLSLSEEMVKE